VDYWQPDGFSEKVLETAEGFLSQSIVSFRISFTEFFADGAPWAA